MYEGGRETSSELTPPSTTFRAGSPMALPNPALAPTEGVSISQKEELEQSLWIDSLKRDCGRSS